MDVNNQLIGILRETLTQNAVLGVQDYIPKLQNNLNNQDQFEDLLYEGYAALLFSAHGFSVKMQDSPDLSLQLSDDQFLSEVKRFRRKTQDAIDQKRMQRANHLLVRYGNPEAWGQVFNDIREKSQEYRGEYPFIVVLASSSQHCIEDCEVQTAANYAKEPSTRKYNPELERLNGILFLSSDIRLNPLKDVYWFPIEGSKVPLPSAVADRLGTLNGWHRIKYGILQFTNNKLNPNS